MMSGVEGGASGAEAVVRETMMQKKKGVVVCVQPWLEDRHYASAATFKQALAALLAQVERRSETTTAEADDENACPMLVVFPEMVVLHPSSHHTPALRSY
jgi:hypothetical protein